MVHALSWRNLIPFTTVLSDLPGSREFQNQFVRVLRVGFQFFYARLTLAVPFSFFLPLPIPPPPDGVSLLHFARSRSFHAWHRSNAWRARKEGGCRIGRRIREIAGTMDSLASTVYFRKRNSSFLETRGNLAEILEKIRNGWVRKKEEGKKKTGKRKGKAYNEKKKKKNCFAWVREVKER